MDIFLGMTTDDMDNKSNSGTWESESLGSVLLFQKN